jgi:hypothetical protein
MAVARSSEPVSAKRSSVPSSLKQHRLQILRRIPGLERDVVAGGWRRLHNEELHNLNLYGSPNTNRVIKCRMM